MTSKFYIKSVILLIKTNSEKELSWKDIQHEFKARNLELTVSYLRFKDNVGHIGIHQQRGKELLFTPEIEVNGEKLTVERCQGEELVKFFEEHGSHFEMCVNKGKDRKKGNHDKYSLGEGVKLGEEFFDDATLIKARTRKILAGANENEKLNENDEKVITALLEYHRNKDEILNNLDHVTVSKEDDSYSKNYVVVKKDGTKQDVNVPKCIENLIISSNKGKKSQRRRK